MYLSFEKRQHVKLEDYAMKIFKRLNDFFCFLTLFFPAVCLIVLLGNVELFAGDEQTFDFPPIEKEIFPIFPTQFDGFGSSVSISGDYAIVGAPYDDDLSSIYDDVNGEDSGSVYVYERRESTWAQVDKLTWPWWESDPGNYFGHRVALSGDHGIVSVYSNIYGTEPEGVCFIGRNQDGTNWGVSGIVTPSDVSVFDCFGCSVAISGDYALAGEPGDDDMGEDSGSVYVFESIDGSFTEVTKLNASDGATDQHFGASVAVSGNFAVVGAVYPSGGVDGTGSGSVYVFERLSGFWTEVTKLTPSDGATENRFGSAVAIDGNHMIVGAWGDDENGYNAGAVYFFERISGTWEPLGKQISSDLSAGDWFGKHLSISGNQAVVQASGAAYVFEYSGGLWTQVSKVTISGEYLSGSISISGSHFISGLTGNSCSNFQCNSSGLALIFEQNGSAWNPTDKLNPWDGAKQDFFGESIAMSGDYAVVGASGDDNDNGQNFGAAYFFKRNGPTWTQKDKLIPLGIESGDGFGKSVAMDGDSAIVGAPNKVISQIGPRTGTAFVFRLSGGNWIQEYQLNLPGELYAENFGSSIGISGDYAVVGSPNDYPTSSRAWVFERLGSTWTNVAMLSAAGAGTGGDTGAIGHHKSVAVSGDFIITGSPSDDENGSGSGAAHLFERVDGSWAHVIKLTASDGAEGDDFSRSVAISGNYAIVGAWLNDGSGIDAGAAYIFERIGGLWTEVIKLSAPDGAAGDWFGRTVDIRGDYAIVGSTNDVDNGAGQGAVYIFVRRDGSWIYVDKRSASDGKNFGKSVSMTDDPVSVVVGHDDSANGDLSGSVYFYFWDQDGDDIGDSWDADMDGDGMPNDYETEKGFDPRDSADGGRDVDIDGFDSVMEYRAATDPNDNSEHPGALALIPDKLFAADGAAEDEFGISISIDGDRAIVGAYHDDNRYNLDCGSAYLFERNSQGTWEQVAKLTAGDGETGDKFGVSVSIDGDRAIVGARGDDDLGLSSGSAYVYENRGGTWIRVAKLTGFEGTAGDHFGTAVAIRGDWAIVGADGDDHNGTDAGAAYVFTRIDGSWELFYTLRANLDGAAGDHFGAAVSFSGDFAVVGAYLDDNENGTDAGSAYVFMYTTSFGWPQTAKLTASDGAADDHFGTAVAIDGGYIVVGADLKDENGTDAGSAYVYKSVNAFSWPQIAKLTASDGTAGDHFGTAVAVRGDYAVVGADLHDENCVADGSAYVFERTGESWSEMGKLAVMDCAADDHFGTAVAVSGNEAIVAAPADDDCGAGSGSVYVWSWDRDKDGLSDFRETVMGTDPYDADSDDDGVADGVEDANQNGVMDSGETNPLVADTDGDGILDGTECGVSAPVPDPDGDGPMSGTDSGVFIADADPDTITDPLDSDSDDDLVNDGVEDADHNGRVDPGEADAAKHQGEVKILPTLPGDGDGFGVSVDISGSYAIVGATWNDDIGDNAGSAYVFKSINGSWIQAARLTASDGAPGDYFGSAVAINGNYAIVGADDHDLNSKEDAGAAYVFERIDGSWTEVAKLTASDSDAFARFGDSVCISTDYAIVGASADDEKGVGSGSAYVFENSGGSWTEVTKLTASDGAAGDRFGNSVAISGDYAILGAVLDDDHGDASGSAYVFEKNGGSWNEVTKLIASDGAAEDYFGTSVAISDNYAIVGASLDDDNGLESGSAYIFEISGGSWTEVTKLTASDGAAGDIFGTSVAISNGHALMGASGDSEKGAGSGSVYVFLRTGSTWNQVAELTASDGAAGDRFGTSVAISGNYAMLGAYKDDDNGLTDSGAAYGFSLDQDGDGLFDYREDAMGTDPYDADSDTDSMPDGWEVENDLNPLTDDALLDYDSDRFCNLREYLSISDPWNDQDIPFIIADFDFDEDIDGIELAKFINDYGRDVCLLIDLCEFDFNGDGKEDRIDLKIFSEDFGRIGVPE